MDQQLSVIEKLNKDLENYKPEFTQNLDTNPEIIYIPREILMTDKGNVMRLLNSYRNDILHNKALGFCIWNGKHWQIDAEHLLHKMVADVHEVMIEEILTQPDKKSRKEMADWVRQSNNQSRISAVINYLHDDGEVWTDVNTFDEDDWLLNCQNGTLDLKTGQLRDFKRSDFITRILPYDYDATAKCERWLRFLEEVLEPDEIPWVQRIAGYSLTGDASAQMFMFLSGVGRNGKGILLQTLLKVLGSYGQSLPPNSIMAKYGDAGIPNDIAMLKGARLVVVPEVPAGKKWNEELLKSMTGEDEIVARFLNKEFFKFKCKGKLWISGNTQPTVTDSGISFWKRLKLLQFKQVFENPDMDLGKNLEGEIPGILNWALEGLAQVLSRGIAVGVAEPESVKKQTLQYRSDNDSIGRFIDECCEVGKDFSVSSTKLYSAYKEWVNNEGEARELINKVKFSQRLVSLNYAKQRDEKGVKFFGLVLQEVLQEKGKNDQLDHGNDRDMVDDDLVF